MALQGPDVTHNSTLITRALQDPECNGFTGVREAARIFPGWANPGLAVTDIEQDWTLGDRLCSSRLRLDPVPASLDFIQAKSYKV